MKFADPGKGVVRLAVHRQAMRAACAASHRPNCPVPSALKTGFARGVSAFVRWRTSQGETELIRVLRLSTGAHALDDCARKLECGLDADMARRRGDADARPAGGGKNGLGDSGGIDLFHAP